MKNILIVFICLLIMALIFSACTQAPQATDTTGAQTHTALENSKTYGQGKHQFSLTVTGSDGKDICVTVCTDKQIVGEALQELGIITGEEGPYGLYIKTVNGETLDYDTHGMYWGFYVNGQYAMTGIDQTAIEADVQYALKAEKG